ncbi:MAG: S24/S26 family peptidase [Clostridia bacterium]|nr:S24/S26 family peptidase [Clostridia bacterium]
MREIHFEQLESLMPLIREGLNAGRSVRFSPRGISMLPMLRQGIDSVVLSPLPEQLKKYDILFYQRDNGKYILHRIVEVGETYTCMGDNQFVPEHGLTDVNAIAVVTAFYRGERFCSVKSPIYRLYCVLWYRSRHLRHFWQRGIRWLRRHLGR